MNENCSITEPERLYGIEIKKWFWISITLLGSNIFILMVCCCMCSSLKGCKPKEYRPKQMFDFLKMLVDATSRDQSMPSSSSAQNQNVTENLYIVEDYSEIAEMLPAPPPPPPKPSTSFGDSDGGYMEPRVIIKPPCIKSASIDDGTVNENAEGYNSLTLRNNSTTTLDQEYAMVTPKAERGKGKTGVDGKSKAKSKLQTLKQIGERISDIFAVDRSSNSRAQTGFDSFRPVVESNIYTIDGDETVEYSGRESDAISDLPQQIPPPLKDGNEYRVLEPQTGYCSDKEKSSPENIRKPFQYDIARNEHYSKSRKQSNLTASGAFLLSISSDHKQETSFA